MGNIYSRCKEKRNLVVNYHFYRVCNYKCKFCFHTQKTSDLASENNAKKAIRILKQHGMTRMNFSGGEPFLKPRFLGNMCIFCYQLGISTSIVSNGSKIRERWFKKYGQYLDVLAISCDSFNPETLEQIGRGDKGDKHLNQLHRIRSWCREYSIKFKINTVVCSVNHSETMVDHIKELDPCRWKVFQCLEVYGENSGPDALRDAKDMLISSEQFENFVKRNNHEKLVPENNDTMRNSYIMMDEHLCLLDNQNGSKVKTTSVLKDIQQAFSECGFDSHKFKKRGGEWCSEDLKW